MSNKTRLDVLLVEQGLLESRQKAQAVIMAGSVFVDGQRVDKPGTAVPNTAAIQVRGHALPYVSRGGLKLEKAMQTFPLTLDGKVCADIGASTGGFTDCMLQNGATKVYAVDVGYGQLDWKLRGDPRVVCMERTNARYLTHEQIPEELDFASVDVSFISLRLILPEANLKAPNVDEYIADINASMDKYLTEGVFQVLPESLVYIERQQSDGRIRHGLIGSGVYASHGYERSHIDGVWNTLKVLKGYLNI